MLYLQRKPEGAEGGAEASQPASEEAEVAEGAEVAVPGPVADEEAEGGAAGPLPDSATDSLPAAEGDSGVVHTTAAAPRHGAYAPGLRVPLKRPSPANEAPPIAEGAAEGAQVGTNFVSNPKDYVPGIFDCKSCGKQLHGKKCRRCFRCKFHVHGRITCFAFETSLCNGCAKPA